MSMPSDKAQAEILASGRARDGRDFKHDGYVVRRQGKCYVVLDLFGPSGDGSPHPHIFEIAENQVGELLELFTPAQYWDEYDHVDTNSLAAWAMTNHKTPRWVPDNHWACSLERPTIKGRG